VADTTGDTVPDVFTDLPRETDVCFEVYARMNDAVPETCEPQVHVATLEVVSGEGAVVDSREIYFVIPAELYREYPTP
jgi:hypothetical protein